MHLPRRFIRHVTNPAVLRRSGDGDILRYYEEFRRTQFLDPEQIRAMQLGLLKELVEHAGARCPFYRDRFAAAGFEPGDLKSLEDVAGLPPLEKREIQENRDAMVAEGWPAEDLLPNQTGGSTGSPISFFVDRDRHRTRLAGAMRHNAMAGWEVGDRIAYVWGAVADRPPSPIRAKLRQALTGPTLFLDTANLTEAKMLGFHRELSRFRPDAISAYARSLALLARFFEARGLVPHQPRTIVTSAEVLEPEDRVLIERVFRAPIFNRYGCREFSIVASECDRHDGLHAMSECLLVEVVRDGRPADPGEQGEILVTDLRGRGMPMIRYRIGDAASWMSGPCACGRGLPRLESVAGRVTDFLVGPDGRLVSGVYLATYVVAQRPGLGQVQILQDRPGALTYRVVRTPALRDPEDLDYLREATARYVGEGTEVSWDLVDAIPSEPSGKYLFSRSTVAPEFLAGPAHAPSRR